MTSSFKVNLMSLSRKAPSIFLTFQVGDTILQDIKDGAISSAVSKQGSSQLDQLLNKQSTNVVSFKDWEKIDEIETARGQKLGKPREKITDLTEIPNILGWQ